MNKPLVKIDITTLFVCLFSIRALIRSTPVDAALVLIAMTAMAIRIWFASKKKVEQEALDTRIKALEDQLSTLQTAITLKRSY
jgi:hypothetical protein